MNFFKTGLLIITTSLIFTIYILKSFQPVETPAHTDTPQQITTSPDRRLVEQPFGKNMLVIRNLSRYNADKALQMLESLEKKNVLNQDPIYRAYYLMTMVNIKLNKAQPDEVIKYTEQLKVLAEKYQMDWLVADALAQQAINETKAGKFSVAISLLDQASVLAKKEHYESLFIKIYNTYGVINNIQGDYPQAQKYFHQGLKYIERYPESVFHSKIISNLAAIYIYFEEWDKALEYIHKSIAIYNESKIANPSTLAVVYLNLSYTHFHLGDLLSAQSAFKQAQAQVSLAPSVRLKVSLLKAKSDLLYLEKKYTEGLNVIQQCTSYDGINDLPQERSICYSNQGLFQLKLHDNKAAIKSFNKAISGFDSLSNQTYLTLNDLYLSQAYEALGDVEQSLQYLKKYYQAHEKSLFDRRQSELYQIETAYNSKKHQQMLELSKAENELKNIKLQKQDILVRVIIVLTLITILTLIFALRKNSEIRKKNEVLRNINTDLAKLSYQDPLTGLYNRRFFYHYLKLIKNSDENFANRYFSMVIFDLDHFKSINDNYGHEAGDQVLVELSQRISSTLSESDVLMRWGGEEFVCLIEHEPNTSVAQQLDIKLFNHTRVAINTIKGELTVTLSAGVISHVSIASLVNHDQELLVKADNLLYQAKVDGRDQAKIKKRDE